MRAGISPTIEIAGIFAPGLLISVRDIYEAQLVTKLNIGNIPRTATDKDLLVMFGQFGTVHCSGITKDPRSGMSTGCGYVEMGSDLEAESAIRRLNFTQYGGRTISVSRAR